MVLPRRIEAVLFTLKFSIFTTTKKFFDMATTKTLLDFAKNALGAKESTAVKGGKAYVPTDTGSVGYINWDDVVIREDNLQTSPSQTLQFEPIGQRK